MAKASDNPYPSLLVVKGTAPATPAAGQQRLYVDSADGLLKAKDDAGVVRTLEGGTPAFKSIKLYRSANQSVSATTHTPVTWNSEEFDDDTYHSTVTNTDRITIPVTGIYQLFGCLAAGVGIPSVTGRFMMTAYKNGDASTGTMVRGSRGENDFPNMGAGGAFPSVNFSVPVKATAGDYFILSAYCTAACTLDAALCTFGAVRLG